MRGEFLPVPVLCYEAAAAGCCDERRLLEASS